MTIDEIIWIEKYGILYQCHSKRNTCLIDLPDTLNIPGFLMNFLATQKSVQIDLKGFEQNHIMHFYDLLVLRI